MSFSNLSKEHKQYFLLGIIVAVALTILIIFGVKVSLSSISNATLELHELSSKIEAADRSVTRNERNQEEFRDTIVQLKGYLGTIPPDRNYYSWATEVIYDEARAVLLEIDAIDEMVMPDPAEVDAGQDRVEMESYSLRITARGSYENVKHFLGRIADNHPLVRVTGLEISAGEGHEVHDVQLFIEWPFNMTYITETWGSMNTEPATSSKPDAPDVKNGPTPPPPRLGQGAGSGGDKPARPTAEKKPVA